VRRVQQLIQTPVSAQTGLKRFKKVIISCAFALLADTFTPIPVLFILHALLVTVNRRESIIFKTLAHNPSANVVQVWTVILKTRYSNANVNLD
jgi:hypothetical protein